MTTMDTTQAETTSKADTDGFPFSTATPEGRAANRAVVCRAMGRGWCAEHAPAPAATTAPVLKHGPNDAWSWCGEKMIRAGALLPEPFGRSDLMKVAKVSETKASNTMTYWRQSGWIVGGSGRWVKTSGFGKVNREQGQAV